MKYKRRCRVPITQSKYDEICEMYEQYKTTGYVHGVICHDVYDLYKVINAELHMHKSERSLRRIYRGEYDRRAFPV